LKHEFRDDGIYFNENAKLQPRSVGTQTKRLSAAQTSGGYLLFRRFQYDAVDVKCVSKRVRVLGDEHVLWLTAQVAHKGHGEHRVQQHALVVIRQPLQTGSEN
jgi:hypothetical protein